MFLRFWGGLKRKSKKGLALTVKEGPETLCYKGGGGRNQTSFFEPHGEDIRRGEERQLIPHTPVDPRGVGG